jgi:hypothetical protein
MSASLGKVKGFETSGIFCEITVVVTRGIVAQPAAQVPAAQQSPAIGVHAGQAKITTS